MRIYRGISPLRVESGSPIFENPDLPGWVGGWGGSGISLTGKC